LLAGDFTQNPALTARLKPRAAPVFPQAVKRWAKLVRPSGAGCFDASFAGLLENEFSRTLFLLA